jgi:putative serine protease PepD
MSKPSPAPGRFTTAPRLPAFLSAGLLVTFLLGCQAGSGATGGPSAGAAVGSSGGPASSSAASIGAGASSVGGTTGGTGTASGDATLLETEFEQVVSAVSPSIVVIETSEGLGSGVIFDTQGDIVTNAHVVGTATSFKVTTSAGNRYDATLVGKFVPDDLAVIKVSGGNLPAATFGDSSKAKVGEIVLAVGNPLGLQGSVTEGIVSAIGRTVTEPGGASLTGVLQTSAAINPGNSGGALVDLQKEVIGIPTLAALDPQLGGSAPGIGFAIPSNTASDIATQIIQNGHVVNSHRAFLGIRAANVQGGQGALVYSEAPGGPAAKAGIPTDVLITSVGGTPVTDAESLTAVLGTLQPGQTVDVTYMARDGTSHTVKVTLGELPG